MCFHKNSQRAGYPQVSPFCLNAPIQTIHQDLCRLYRKRQRYRSGRNFSPGTPVILTAYNTAAAGLYRVDVGQWSRLGIPIVCDSDTSGYCISTATATPGQALILNFCQNNSPAQK